MIGLSDDYNKESTNDERPALSGLTMQFLENNNNEEENKKNGIREGKGIFYWNNGDRYEGDFKNGVR